MTKLINILLQRNDCNIPWGFEIQERKNAQQSIVITRVLPNAVSAYNIHRGDFILQIQDQSVTKLSDNEINNLINKPAKELRLIILQNTKSTIMPSKNDLSTSTASIPIATCQHSEIILSKSLGNPPTKPPVVRFPRQSVENCAPSKKLTQEPNFNTPFYKPQMPTYKKSNQTDGNSNENKVHDKKLQPKKILREFIQNKDGTLNLTERVPISHNTNVRELERRKSFFESFNNENVPNLLSRKNSIKANTTIQTANISNSDSRVSKPKPESMHKIPDNVPSANDSNFDSRKNNSITNLLKSNAEMRNDMCNDSSVVNYSNLEENCASKTESLYKIPQNVSKSMSNFDSRKTNSVANLYSNTESKHDVLDENYLKSDFKEDNKEAAYKIPEILSQSVPNFDSRINSSVSNHNSNTNSRQKMFESLSNKNIPDLDSSQNNPIAVFKPNAKSFQNKFDPNSPKLKQNMLNTPESIHEMLDTLSNDSSYTVNYSIESIQNLDEVQSFENLSEGQIFIPQNYSLSYKNIDKERTAKTTSPFRCFSDNFFNLNNQFKNQIQPNSSRRNRKSKCDVIMTECLSDDETNSVTAEMITNLTSEEDVSNDDDSLYMYELINDNVMYDTKIVSKNVVYDNYVERNYGPDFQMGPMNNFSNNEASNYGVQSTTLTSNQNNEPENLQYLSKENFPMCKNEMKGTSTHMNNFSNNERKNYNLQNNEIISDQDDERKNVHNLPKENYPMPKNENRGTSTHINNSSNNEEKNYNLQNNQMASNQDYESKNMQSRENYTMLKNEVRRTSTLDDLQYFDAYNDVRRISNQDDFQYFDAENNENTITVNQSSSQQFDEEVYDGRNNTPNCGKTNDNTQTILYENNSQQSSKVNYDERNIEIRTLNPNNLHHSNSQNYGKPNNEIRRSSFENSSQHIPNNPQNFGSQNSNLNHSNSQNYGKPNNEIQRSSFENSSQHVPNNPQNFGTQNSNLHHSNSQNYGKPNNEIQRSSFENSSQHIPNNSQNFGTQNYDMPKSEIEPYLTQNNMRQLDRESHEKRTVDYVDNQNHEMKNFAKQETSIQNNIQQCDRGSNNQIMNSSKNGLQNFHNQNYENPNYEKQSRMDQDDVKQYRLDNYSCRNIESLAPNQNSLQYFDNPNYDKPNDVLRHNNGEIKNENQKRLNPPNSNYFDKEQSNFETMSKSEIKTISNQNNSQYFDERNSNFTNNGNKILNQNHFQYCDQQNYYGPNNEMPNMQINSTSFNQNNLQYSNRPNYNPTNNQISTLTQSNLQNFDRENYVTSNHENTFSNQNCVEERNYYSPDRGIQSNSNQNNFQNFERQNYQPSNDRSMKQNNFQHFEKQTFVHPNDEIQRTMIQNNFQNFDGSYNNLQNNDIKTQMNQNNFQNFNRPNYSLPNNEISIPLYPNNQQYFESDNNDLRHNSTSYNQNNFQYVDKRNENLFNQPVYGSESSNNFLRTGLNAPKLPSIQENQCGNSYLYNVQQQNSFRQQQTNSPGNYGNDQPCFAGPPPPPPPPGPCNLPSKRLSTEIPDRRLEPPACVQNAMMTKDKKPFTYTPGGLDLSQIKSPRMARRISRNAQAEGVSEPRQSPLAQPPGQLPPSALAAMQPNLPTPVFPPGGIPPPPPPPSNAGPIQSPPPPPPLNNIQPNVNKPVPPPQNFQRPDIKSIIPPNPTAMLRQTGGPMRRGPYPPEPVDEPTSPEKLQASNNTANKPQLGSLYIPPVKNQEIEENRNSPSNIQSPARNIHTPPSVQSPVLNKAPTPWLTQRVQPQQQSNVPAWAQREDSQPKSPPTVITKVMPVQIEQSTPKPNNVSSIQIQHRPQVFVVNPPQMYQHPMSPAPQQQQHSMSPGPQQQPHPMSPGPQAQKHSRIIPIQIEGSNSPTQMSPAANISRNDSVNQPQWRANGNVQRTQEIPNNQFRKLQLQEDDQNLMNRFKNQVDEDTFLHNETDPRYRGAAIPSRAFRMLQTMTDSASDPIPQYSNAPRNSPGPVIRTIPIQREDDGNAQQQYIPPSEQQAPADPRKYTGSAIPSRSFRMLQAMTSPNNTPCANTQSTENVENYANDPYYSQWGGYDPNYPPHPYWNNPYWAYYSQCYSPQLQQECQDENQTGEQNEQSEQDLNAQYQQYWDQYGYYYNYYPYSYPPVYSPHPFYHQNSDTDNEGAYSSCDEMTYYGALFANKPPKIPQKQQSETPNIIVTSENNAENNPENKSQKNEVKNIEKANSVSDSSESESDSESDADTEVGDQKPIKTKSGSLIAIKSVSDINIYEDSNNYPNDDQDANDDNSNDEESTEENEDEYSAYEEEEEIPHQLSVIFEDDNEVSDYESVRGKKPRQDSEHTLVSEEESFVTVGNGESDTDEEEEGTHTQSTVTVKLPLKLKCSRNEQNEPITTIIVEPTSEIIETHVTLKSPTPCKDKPKEDVSFTINIPSRKNSFETQNNSVTDSKLTDSTQDSDVSISVSLSLKKISDQNNDSSDQLKCETKQEEEESESEEESDSDSDDNDEGSSSSSGDSSSDSSSESESEVENTKDEKDDMNDISEKEKQQILKLLARAKGIEKDETISMNVKDKIKSFEMHIRNESSNSRRNSSKSIVDMTDEEDSGVTSDMSRHISDTDSSECFPELRKMNKYRRAATHSRLFQLLQEEYNAKDEDENETQTNENNINSVKESLTLPLQIDQEESSSGINSPISPTVNDRLVKELVQSLLKRKKGKCFRNLPLEKLHAAALRILQEDMDRYDTISSSEDGGSTAFLSPLPTETVNSSPVQTPQEFFNGNYDDYSAYYSSWAHMASDSENYDILPSRTFKLLQDHATGTKPYKNTVLAKCPRVLSGKNLPKELQKVTETRETPSPLLESNPDNKIEARAT